MGMFSDMILSNLNDLNSISDKHFWSTYLTPEMLEEIREKGDIGAMLARFYDENGEEIDCTWNQRTIGIPLKEIRHVPNVVVAASGKQKAQAITCAIKNGLVDTLITDGSTASVVLGLKNL